MESNDENVCLKCGKKFEPKLSPKYRDYSQVPTSLGKYCSIECYRKRGTRMPKKWYPETIEGEKMQNFADWLNKWADEEKYAHLHQDEKSYRKGYEQAIKDIWDRLGIKFR